ncbi:CRISPR-associated primase-polymerase type A1 [Geobacillus sp. YF-1]|uniref:CRISPR-associated primase-polymerase type A1 n=1 Tax=Geobacillus sp. YF-1 TaxID=3457480 RepID=UPI0040455792
MLIYSNYFIEKRWFALAQWFHDPTPPLSQEREGGKSSEDPAISQEDTFSKFLHLFSGKEDGFLLEVPEQGKRAFLDIPRPLTVDDVRKHYVGEITIVQYIIRSNKTVSYAVIDVDIPKHVLHQIGHEGEAFAAKRSQALRDALRLRETAQKKGFPSYLVDSGFRGYHVWFFFSEPLMLKSAYEFLVKLTAETGTPSDGLTWELFPKQRKLKEGAKGQGIKLPWGKHSLTGRQAWFVDNKGEPLTDQLGALDQIAAIEKQVVLRFIQGGTSSSERLPVRQFTPSPSVLAVVQGCPIASHMVEKAKQTNYLTHQERLFLLNVFAPMGEDGKRFIHHVISHTFNYNFHTTEKFVRRSYDKPISCIRIREHFPGLTAQLGCHCQFHLEKGMYPTPALHSPQFRAVKPLGRKDGAAVLAETAAAKEEKPTESPLHFDRLKHVNELVNKMIQLRKHQRGIQSKLRNIEQELRQVFTELGIDRLEIDQGYLVWKREGNSDRWVIEL